MNIIKKIQKTAVFAAVFAAAVTSYIQADESARVWERLYSRIDTIEYRLEIMRGIAEQNNRALLPVISDALSETNAQRSSIADINEKNLYNQLQILIIKQLGAFKALEAETLIYQTLRDSDNTIVKAEAILALGRIGSERYTDELVLMLRNLNMNLAGSRSMRENETTAYSLIMAFEYLKDLRTFEAVFYAYNGWYSPASGVKERAKNALRIIAEDPTEVLLEIMVRERDFTNKQLAIEAQYDSSAPDEKKSAFAVRGLFEGLTNRGSNLTEQAHLSNIRITACRMLTNSNVKDPAALPYLEEMLYSRYDLNEKLTAIETLGSYSSDEAAAVLGRFLKQHNDWRTDGMTQLIERRAVIAAVNAAANTGNRNSEAVLRSVIATDAWESAVRNAAREALSRLTR